MLRPLTPDGSRPKRDSELSNRERQVLHRIENNGRNIRTDRSRPGGRREK